MVVPVKVTQFYGNSLPRPRIYTDVKFSDQRIDPPASVNDALLSWAADAPWSAGGLSNKRLTTHGALEGASSRLKSFKEEEEEEEKKETSESSEELEESESPQKKKQKEGKSDAKKRQRVEISTPGKNKQARGDGDEDVSFQKKKKKMNKHDNHASDTPQGPAVVENTPVSTRTRHSAPSSPNTSAEAVLTSKKSAKKLRVPNSPAVVENTPAPTSVRSTKKSVVPESAAVLENTPAPARRRHSSKKSVIDESPALVVNTPISTRTTSKSATPIMTVEMSSKTTRHIKNSVQATQTKEKRSARKKLIEENNVSEDDETEPAVLNTPLRKSKRLGKDKDVNNAEEIQPTPVRRSKRAA